MSTDAMPCWFTSKNRAIALALINQANFVYVGREEDFSIYGHKLSKICGWRLASAYGEVALEASCDGAIFGKSLEMLPNIDFEAEVNIAKRVIRQASRSWHESQPVIGIQLVLF